MRKISYYVLLVAAIVISVVRGYDYVSRSRAGQAGTQAAASDLIWICVLAVGFFITLRALLQDKPSQRESSIGIIDRSSPRATLRTLPGAVRLAFSRRPVLASLMSLLVVAIPIGMVEMATGDRGLKQFGAEWWLLIAGVETPILLIALLVALSFRSKR